MAPLSSAQKVEAKAASSLWTENASLNSWPILDQTELMRVEGADLMAAVAFGAVATILMYVVRRYHYEIHPLEQGDVLGYVSDRSFTEAYESNYFSGTAVAIRPMQYPLGYQALFFPRELKVVDDILQKLDSVVSWGGREDYPKESHFQINLPPNDVRVEQMAAQIRSWNIAQSSAAPGKANVAGFV